MEYATKLSDIIASLPEISGGFLYSAEQGVIFNQAESVTDDAALYRIGQKLTKAYSMLSANFQDTGAIRVTFKDLVLFGQKIGDGVWIFLFHNPSLSPGMMKMTVQMALNIEEESVSETEAADSGNVDAPSYETLVDEGSELGRALERIRDELAGHIGPVADLVMEDSVNTWAQSVSPTLASLSGLIEAISAEIDDEEDASQFVDNLKDIQAEE